MSKKTVDSLVRKVAMNIVVYGMEFGITALAILM